MLLDNMGVAKGLVSHSNLKHQHNSNTNTHRHSIS